MLKWTKGARLRFILAARGLLDPSTTLRCELVAGVRIKGEREWIGDIPGPFYTSQLHLRDSWMAPHQPRPKVVMCPETANHTGINMQRMEMGIRLEDE